MPTARMLAVTALLGTAAAGCSIQIGPLGLHAGGGSGGSWGGGTTGTASDQADGQVNYRVCHLSRNGKVFLVIVADGTGGLTRHGGTGGEFGTLDGRTITWACDTTDAETGTVTLAGAEFELENGGLFLITARHGRTWVRQVKADLSRVTGEVDLAAVRSAVADDPVSADFLTRVGKPKPTPREPATPAAGTGGE